MTRRLALALVALVPLLTSACDALAAKRVTYTAVDVRTERRDGTPVAGVPLILFTGQRPMGYDTTNGAGQALFERVPPGPAYGVLAEAPSGYEFPERLLGGPPSNVITMALGADSTPLLRFRFLRVGPGTVTASVVDQAGKGVAGIVVQLYAPSGGLQKATTSAGGTVTFNDVPFGLYGVIAPRPDAYRDSGESPWISQDGLLVEQGVTAAATLALQRCQGTINLTVADPARGGAPDLQTYLYMSTGTVDSARTGADGRVSYLSPGCGEFGVRVVPNNDWSVVPTYADGLVLRRGTVRDVTLTARYNTCRGAIRVTVADAAGVPVSGAVLTLYSADSRSNVTQPAPTGTLTFSDLGCGMERGVAVSPPAGWSAPPGRGTSYVDGLVVANGTTLNVTLTLARLAP